MQVSELSTKVFNFIGTNNFKITNEGKISIGDFLFTIEQYQEYCVKEHLEITRAIEVMTPPLSSEIKTQFINQIEYIQEEIANWLEEIRIAPLIQLEYVLYSKAKYSERLIRILAKDVHKTKADENQESKNPIPKMPFKVSLRELAIILYGFKEAKIYDVEQSELLEFFGNNFCYFNERENEYKEIGIGALRKEYSLVKKGFESQFYHSNPIDKADEKISNVLKHIKSVHKLTAKPVTPR